MECVRLRVGNELDVVGRPQVHACMTDRNYRKRCSLEDVQILEFSKHGITEKHVV